jgi:hypothetical protein
MTNPSPQNLRSSISAFVNWRQQHLTGDEKGEAQVFCERLFQAFGHPGIREVGAVLEARVKRRDERGTAFADLIWKPRCLIEMKKSGTNLARHYRQAFGYWIEAVPDRPRYVILCNFDEFWIYDFDRQLDSPVDQINITDFPKRYEAMAFMLPEEKTPIFGNDLVAVTREAAASVAGVFRHLHERGIDRIVAQRFVLQSVVAMFSEDIGLLPGKFFTRALEDARTGADAYDLLGGLFSAMNSPGRTSGGRYAGTPYFNGGLFDEVTPVDLTRDELNALKIASTNDWSAVRPEIFGTLFETSMDASERHAYGAHFTSQADIAKVVIPTIVQPWTDRINAASTISDYEKILLDMASYRVLDPACGSGNFLYVAYREMRRLEAEVKQRIDERRRSRERAAQTALSYVLPDHFLGIDLNPYAVEVAKVTMMLAKKLASDELNDHINVLPLDNLDSSIRAVDALFTEWPKAQAIIGNPPYLGRRKMVEELGVGYTRRLAERYPNIKAVSDFVTYWFPLTHDALPKGGRAGLVATQNVRDSATRQGSLDYVVDNGGVIVEAVSSQPWSGDAVVYVSIINWVKEPKVEPAERILWLDNGQLRLPTPHISPSLRPTTDVSTAADIPSNKSPKVCFQGQTTGFVDGFRLSPQEAAHLVKRDPKSVSVIHPMIGGDSLISKLGVEEYVIDIPSVDAVEAEAVAAGAMTHLRGIVLPLRIEKAKKEADRNAKALAKEESGRTNRHHEKFLRAWWRHAYRRDDMLDAIANLGRYIALTIVSAESRKSIYQFVDTAIRPDASLQVFAFNDDYSFGVLSSSLHRIWFDERCTQLKADPRYTPNTVWNTFPWPLDPPVNRVAEISRIVGEILQLRCRYLGEGITLVRQYDTLREEGQSQLRSLHDHLDAAVFMAYGFNSEDDALAQLLALNLAAADGSANAQVPGGQAFGEAAHASNYRLGPPGAPWKVKNPI